MTIIHEIHLSLEIRRVLRGKGIRQYSSVGTEIKALIHKLLVSINDDHLLEPAMCLSACLTVARSIMPSYL